MLTFIIVTIIGYILKRTKKIVLWQRILSLLVTLKRIKEKVNIRKIETNTNRKKRMLDKVVKYLPYLLLTALLAILFIVFIPSKDISNLTNKEIKTINKENKAITKQYNSNKDSIEVLTKEVEKLSKIASNSKTKTIIIKQKTNEEVNRIPTLPFDSNVALFARDLEEYLINR